jgi:hypothetical protein
MAFFYGKWSLQSKIILEDQIVEQINTFYLLGCHISYFGETDITQKRKN